MSWDFEEYVGTTERVQGVQVASGDSGGCSKLAAAVLLGPGPSPPLPRSEGLFPRSPMLGLKPGRQSLPWLYPETFSFQKGLELPGIPLVDLGAVVRGQRLP